MSDARRRARERTALGPNDMEAVAADLRRRHSYQELALLGRILSRPPLDTPIRELTGMTAPAANALRNSCLYTLGDALNIVEDHICSGRGSIHRLKTVLETLGLSYRKPCPDCPSFCRYYYHNDGSETVIFLRPQKPIKHRDRPLVLICSCYDDPDQFAHSYVARSPEKHLWPKERQLKKFSPPEEWTNA